MIRKKLSGRRVAPLSETMPHTQVGIAVTHIPDKFDFFICVPLRVVVRPARSRCTNALYCIPC